MNFENIVCIIKDKLEEFADSKSVINPIVEVEKPQDFKNGHFSSNFALKNAKALKSSPQIIAKELAEFFKDTQIFEEVSIAGPGFLNFFLSNEVIAKMLNSSAHEKLIKIQVQDREKYNLEYVSANPTGELHLGHARNAIFSDSLYRVMKAAGFDVTREYYINDAGAQMINLGKSIYFFYLEALGKDSEFPEDGYRGPEIKNMGYDLAQAHGEKLIDQEISYFTKYGYEINMQEIKNVLKSLNIEFDVFSSEKNYHDNGSVAKVIDVLDGFGDVYKEEGATWLNTEKNGDDKNRVIEKSDSTHTYFTSDIAYHYDKFERGFTKLIDIWGGDHHGYVSRIKAAMLSLGKDKSDVEVILIQMVSVLRNNEVVKMSKRAGTSVTIKDLLNEVDKDVIRYFFVMRSNDTQLDFDIEVAKTNSIDNPVFYVNYASARISSVFEKASQYDLDTAVSSSDFLEIEKQIIIKLASFNSIVLDSAKKRQPHMVTNYLYEVASLFHRYYSEQKVYEGELSEIKKRLDIYKATKNVITEGLDLVGITAKNKM